MEITTIEGFDYARFSTGHGDDELKVSADIESKSGMWKVSWSSYGPMHPAVARHYAHLINKAVVYCEDKNSKQSV